MIISRKQRGCRLIGPCLDPVSVRESYLMQQHVMVMGDETTKSDDSNLAGRILLTLHLADRRGYGLCLVHLSKILICGEVAKEAVLRELQTMPEVSHSGGIYCLKGREYILTKTRKKLNCHSKHVKVYEGIARRFA